MKFDKRRKLRLKHVSDAEIHAHLDEMVFKVTSLNISQEGALFFSMESLPLEIGEVCVVKMNLDPQGKQEEITIAAELRHISGGNYGFHFIEADEDSKILLNQYIRHRHGYMLKKNTRS